MSDAARRELERAAAAGDPEAAVAALVARLRAGELSRDDVLRAALDGDEPAAAVVAVSGLDRREVRDWRRRWREAFASHGQGRRARQGGRDYDWHAFTFVDPSPRFAELCTGRTALERGRERGTGQAVAWLEGQGWGWTWEATGIPDLRSSQRDLYVMATDLSWTLVFTHEEHLGPFWVLRAAAEPE